jgi:hypothetical protein
VSGAAFSIPAAETMAVGIAVVLEDLTLGVLSVDLVVLGIVETILFHVIPPMLVLKFNFCLSSNEEFKTGSFFLRVN